MKNKLFLLAFFIYGIYHSQTVSDIGKIVLSVGSVENVELSLSSEERLKNKLIQIVNNSGMTSFDYSNFYITPKISINTEVVEGGMQNITVAWLDVNLIIHQPDTGLVFSTYSTSLKGGGTSKEKAINDVFNKIKVNSKEFKDFIHQGKEKIVSYYQSKCNSIITSADNYAKKGEHEYAIATLMSIPEEVGSCYTTAQNKSIEIYKQLQSKNCNELQHKAQVLIANKEYEGALSILMSIDSSSPCFANSKKLIASIESKIKAEDKKQWDFMMEQYNDAVNIEKQRINAVKEVAVSYFRSQRNNTKVYIVR